MALRTANIIGSGPNGLAAAVTLAQRGVAVTLYERNERLGGACATAEVTLPGFRHDLGSSAYPLGIASPFFRTLELERYGLRWIQPDTPVAHPLDDVTRPLLRIPRHPIVTARFGLSALLSAHTLASMLFREERAKALFVGIAAHSVLPLTHLSSAAAGVLLGAAGHATGWPITAGGGQAIADALAAHLRSLGGEIVCGVEVKHLNQLPPADVTLFDTGVEALIRIAGDALATGYVRRLRGYKSGPAVFKLDYALSAPIPWRNQACTRAATVHLGGTLDEITASEDAAFHGRLSGKPFVLLVQPSLFDSSRAPEGKHTAWAYCHVPYGSNADRTAVIEAQIERFAPGFRDCVLARQASNASDLARWNPNLLGGDISGGAMTVGQLIARPTLGNYKTSNPKIYLCSASTPPGGGVHGMCGHNAALAALQRLAR
jgi:phytoene dehydrogenase-like protein